MEVGRGQPAGAVLDARPRRDACGHIQRPLGLIRESVSESLTSARRDTRKVANVQAFASLGSPDNASLRPRAPVDEHPASRYSESSPEASREGVKARAKPDNGESALSVVFATRDWLRLRKITRPGGPGQRAAMKDGGGRQETRRDVEARQPS